MKELFAYWGSDRSLFPHIMKFTCHVIAVRTKNINKYILALNNFFIFNSLRYITWEEPSKILYCMGIAQINFTIIDYA